MPCSRRTRKASGESWAFHSAAVFTTLSLPFHGPAAGGAVGGGVLVAESAGAETPGEHPLMRATKAPAVAASVGNSFITSWSLDRYFNRGRLIRGSDNANPGGSFPDCNHYIPSGQIVLNKIVSGMSRHDRPTVRGGEFSVASTCFMNTKPTAHSKMSHRSVAVIPTCRDMSRLSSEALDHPHSPLMKVRMAVHLMFCRLCRRYAQQLRWLHRAGKSMPDEVLLGVQLPPTCRERIKEALRNKGQ